VRIIAIGVVGVLWLVACGGGGKPADDAAVPFDAGPVADASGATDAAPVADAAPTADAAPMPARQILMQTSGGGAMASPGFKARLGAGAPQPMGAASSSNHKVTTGPAAARP